jgi:UPF0716 family protein affecting phage T7 exclusion
MSSSPEPTREDLMARAKSLPGQQMVVALTLLLVLGALSMIWPGIIALFLGVLLLLESCGLGQEIVVLSWTEVGQAPMVFASLRRPGLPAILS